VSTQGAYFDTGVLAKWYVNEPRSDDVEAYIKTIYPVYISLLTRIEMKSLAALRVREGHFDYLTQFKVLSTFEGDIAAGHIVVLPYTTESLLIAESLIGSYPEIPLRGLDAMHLGVMKAAGVTTLATADLVMAQAAEALGMRCETFSSQWRGRPRRR
jgi:predicted nucleic acid-binding protein